MDRIGQQLGNYRVLRLLGQGGFADVYMGEHVHLGTYAAIKVLHTRLGRTAITSFREEARTIARLEHPHIVRILDFGIEEDFPFLVMDYAPKGTLRLRHPQGVRLPLETVCAYVDQIADALQYAHDNKLIHRDVKPENMLVGRRESILLSDFGIAVSAHRTHSMTLQNEAGTILYMAPEQTQGKARPASDQYALAAVVYEWLSGSPPFHGDTAVEIALKHLTEEPADLSTIVPLLSPDVSRVVARALAKDPLNRFSQIWDFALALKEAMQQQEDQKETYISPKGFKKRNVYNALSPAIPDTPVAISPANGKHRPFRWLFSIHWLFLVGLGMISALMLWLVGSAVLTWGTQRYYDFHYGYPRTYQTDMAVGHGGDSPAHPSHFIAINQNNQVIVIELKADDPAKVAIYKTPITIYDGGQSPVTLSFRDVNGDHKLDMIIDIHLSGQDQYSTFINEGDNFRPATSNDSIQP